MAELYNIQGLYAQALPLYIESTHTSLSQIDHNFAHLSENEKGLFYKTFSDSFNSFNAFASKYYAQKPAITIEVYNNILATKALLFHATNKMRTRVVSSQDSSLIILYQTWQNKKEYLSKAYSLSIKDREKQGIDLPTLETETNEIERQLSTRSEIFATVIDNKWYAWTDVQKLLKKGDVAMEIIRFYQADTVKYMALLITPASLYPDMILLPNGNELEGKYAKNYLNRIKSKAIDTTSYRVYWEKIAAQLKGVKKVYLSVDGVYNGINLHTLYNPKTGKYLDKMIDIELLSNTKDLIVRKKIGKKAFKNSALMGYPAYNLEQEKKKTGTEERTIDMAWAKAVKRDTLSRFFDGGDIPALPNTQIEVNNLEKILQAKKIGVQKFLGKEASEANLKALRSPDMLHIATHGYFLKNAAKEAEESLTLGIDSKKFFENPLLRSGLLLADAKNAIQSGGDGILTAFEAMNLHLDDTDLVVMSACETGLGEAISGEGVYGLQRAFQTAGAKTVLMSLWTVSDEATQELMTLFYENLITKGQTKRVAFKNAQKELKKKYPEPYYWGAFVMVGE